MRAPTLTHVALHVPDVTASVAFYQRYCGLELVHERHDPRGSRRVVWLAEPSRRNEFIFVFIGGGPAHEQPRGDFGHLGFAVESRARVDAIAERARGEGCLMWEPIDEPYPVGYYCGVRAPEGRAVEFSFGQPLGPGAANTPDADVANDAAAEPTQQP